jgi:endonuclease-3
MINNRNIDKVISIVEKQVQEFGLPYVSDISITKRNPFKILISTVLSSRTKDMITKQATQRLFSKIQIPQNLLKLPEEELIRLIYPVGFYRVKAKNLKKLSRILVEKHNSQVPNTIDELVKLPGVGRKTANLVITLGFNKYGICVDTHVHRIVNRWNFIKTKKPLETEEILRKKLPKKFWKIINTLLVVFGQNICVPISPKCNICNLNKICPKKEIKISINKKH